jgi:hypothetical protein
MKKKILMKRFNAAKRGLGLANTLSNESERKKHKSRIMRNINIIRALLSKT